MGEMFYVQKDLTISNPRYTICVAVMLSTVISIFSEPVELLELWNNISKLFPEALYVVSLILDGDNIAFRAFSSAPAAIRNSSKPSRFVRSSFQTPSKRFNTSETLKPLINEPYLYGKTPE